MKNSSVSLYVDAELVSTQKVSEEKIVQIDGTILSDSVLFLHTD